MNKSTDEQEAIFSALRTGSGDLIIDALAGSGKTHTLINALTVIPQKTVLLTAFNKRISEELQEKLPKQPKGSVWATATFHSAGYRIVNACKRGARLDLKPEATEELVNEAVVEIGKYSALKLGFKARRIAVRLLRTYKEIFSGPEINVETVKSIGINYDAELSELPDNEIQDVSNVIAKGYDLGLDLQSRTSIDYCDMIWLPVVNNLKTPSRYQAIFCDELQDLSLIQWELMKMLRAPGGRFVGVGDLNQAVYGWRGAIGKEVFAELGKDAKTMPLTTTFRCSQAVVKEAQAIVPQLKPCATARPGLVQHVDLETAIASMADASYATLGVSANGEHCPPKSFVLSRTNAELIRVALDLYDEDVDFDFLGAQEVLGPIKDLVQKFDKSSSSRFQANIDTWYQVELRRAEKQHASAWADRLEQYYTILNLMVQRAQPSQIVNMLFDICARSANANITLSSVHKVKGLEADIVYLMRLTFHRHQQWRKEPVTQEEKNLEYVAITRSRNALVWVDAEPARFNR